MADITVAAAHSTDVIARDAQLPQTHGIEIAAARGEAESVQLVLRADADVDAVRVSVDGLQGASLRRLVDVQGVPDALVPFEDTSIAPGQSEIIWLTVRVARDAQAGETSGEVTVEAAGQIVRVPVRLTVWDLELPVTPCIPAFFGVSDAAFSQPPYDFGPGPEREATMAQWYEFLIDYRVSPYFCHWGGSMQHFAYPSPWPIDDPRTDNILRDPRLTAFAIPYPEDGSEAELRRTLTHLREKGLLHRGYFYLWDEPNREEQYARIRAMATKIHSIEPGARVLTTYYCGIDGAGGDDALDVVATKHLKGATQIFCMSTWATGGDESYAAHIQSLLGEDEEWWSYVCCGPGEPHPNLFLTMTGLKHRAVMWRVFKEGGTGFLYWALNAYATAPVGGPVTFREGLPAGDGALCYPGEAFGAKGPVASVRLERFRDSMEDYEYLRLHEASHGREATLGLLSSIYRGPNIAPIDPDLIEAFRRAVATGGL